MTTSKMNMRVAALAVIMVVGVLLSNPASAATSSAPGNCLTNIATSCSLSDNTDSPTAAQIQPCCNALSSAIDDDRACFCLLKTQMDDPSTKNAFTTVFKVCSIDGSFDTICSGSDSSSTGSSPNGSAAKGLKGNAGNKIEMKSVSSLLIALICLLVMRSI